jgi:UDP-glucose 4-epimerase
LVEELVKSVDVVFHLASAVGVKLIIEQPVKTIETIIEGTSIILSQARRYRKKVLITSSSEVYGKGSKVPFSENDDTVMGCTGTRRWAYGAAKGIDEFLAFAHWHETKLPVICVRLFNTVGPRQTGQYGMVIPTFIQQALAGKDITVYGHGFQTRSFCNVMDVVPALVALMNCDNAIGKVVNIGSNEEISIAHLAEKIKELTGTSSKIINIPYEKAYTEGFEDLARRVPNINLAKELIGFKPQWNLNETLKSILDGYEWKK